MKSNVHYGVRKRIRIESIFCNKKGSPPYLFSFSMDFSLTFCNFSSVWLQGAENDEEHQYHPT